MKQIIGCNMGAILSAKVSDTKMCKITNHVMSKFKFPNQILYNERMREDFFAIDTTIYKGIIFQKNKILEIQSYVT